LLLCHSVLAALLVQAFVPQSVVVEYTGHSLSWCSCPVWIARTAILAIALCRETQAGSSKSIWHTDIMNHMSKRICPVALTPDEQRHHMIAIAVKQGRTLAAPIPLEDDGEEHMQPLAKKCTDACSFADQTRGELTMELTR